MRTDPPRKWEQRADAVLIWVSGALGGAALIALAEGERHLAVMLLLSILYAWVLGFLAYVMAELLGWFGGGRNG